MIAEQFHPAVFAEDNRFCITADGTVVYNLDSFEPDTATAISQHHSMWYLLRLLESYMYSNNRTLSNEELNRYYALIELYDEQEVALYNAGIDFDGLRTTRGQIQQGINPRYELQSYV